MRLTTKDLLRKYNDFLDAHGVICIETPAGPFEYLRSFVLREVSADAYREGLNAFASAMIKQGYIVEGYTDNTEPGDES